MKVPDTEVEGKRLKLEVKPDQVMEKVAFIPENVNGNWLKLFDKYDPMTKYPNNIFNQINMIVNKENIPQIDLTFLNNKFDNQILAVTVKKLDVEMSKFPEKWEKARQSELDSLKKFGVFTEIDRQNIPNDHPDPIGCRWLYTLKKLSI